MVRKISDTVDSNRHGIGVGGGGSPTKLTVDSKTEIQPPVGGLGFF